MRMIAGARPHFHGTPLSSAIPAQAFPPAFQPCTSKQPALCSLARSKTEASTTSYLQHAKSRQQAIAIGKEAAALEEAQEEGPAGKQMDDLDLDYSLQDRDDRLRSHAQASISASNSTNVNQENAEWHAADSGAARQQQAAAQKASQFTWVGHTNTYDRSYKNRSHNDTRNGSRHKSSGYQRCGPPQLGQQQQQGHRYQTNPATPGPIDAPLLTNFLTSCNRLDELYGLFFRHHHRFNHIHVSCAMNRLAWLRDSSTAADQNAECIMLMLTPLESMFIENLELYTVREVANALWSWAKLRHHPSDASLSAIMGVITANNGAILIGRNAKPQALANLAWGACQLQCRNRHVWGLLASAVRKGLRAQTMSSSSRNPSSYSNSSKGDLISGEGLLRIGNGSDVGHGGVGREVDDRGFVTRAIGGYQGEGSMKGLALDDQHPYQQPFDVYSPVDLSLIAWSFATARVYHAPLYEDLAAAAMDHLADFCPQDLTNMLWAFAQVGHPAPELFEACVPAIKSMITGFTPQGLANLAWAFVKAGMPDADVLGSVARQASRSFYLLEPVHISQLVWSMVRAHQVYVPLLQAAMATAAANTHKYKSKELALVLWAVAVSTQTVDRDSFMTIGAALLQRMGEDTEQGSDAQPGTGGSSSSFLPQDVANIVYAYSKSGFYDANVFDTAIKLCMHNKEAWLASHEAFRGTVWSLGNAGHYDAPLFALSNSHLRQLAAEGHVHMKVLACVLQPSAMMRHYDEECCKAVCQLVHARIQQNHPEVTHETLANVLWSLAVLGHKDLPLMRAAFAWVHQRWHNQQQREARMGAKQDSSEGAVGIKQLMQYFQAYLWLTDLGTQEARVTGSALPQGLVEDAAQAWRLQAERQAYVSDFQMELHYALHQMGLQPRMEHITADGLFSVDMVVDLGDCMLAVEANGPSHYTATSPQRLLGNKVLRDNFLRVRGYKVLNVAWWRWHTLLQESGYPGIFEYLWSELLEVVRKDSKGGQAALAIHQQHQLEHRRPAKRR